MSKKLARLIRKFKDREYREEYTNAFFDSLISSQIRALRKRAGLTQAQLGTETGTTQPGISAFESDEYSTWSLSTLRKIAKVFDVAVIVRFASYGDVLKEVDDFGKDAVFVVPFESDQLSSSGAGGPESVTSAPISGYLFDEYTTTDTTAGQAVEAYG